MCYIMGYYEREVYEWVEDSKITGLKGSDGWLNVILTRHGLKRMNLHGEADDLKDEEIVRVIFTCRDELQELIEEKHIRSSCTYNVYQTDLFYEKPTNSLYIENSGNKGYKGYKQMKDKTRVDTFQY